LHLLGVVTGGVLAAGLLLLFAVRSGIVIQPGGNLAERPPPAADNPVIPGGAVVSRPSEAVRPSEEPAPAMQQESLPVTAPTGQLSNLPPLPDVEREQASVMATLNSALNTADQAMPEDNAPSHDSGAAVAPTPARVPVNPPAHSETAMQDSPHAVAVIPAPAAVNPPVDVKPKGLWQPFWGPFNTRASAEGFAARIAQQTGLEIRARDDNHGHMVAFHYDTEDERLGLKAFIEDKTGLKITLR